jgi:hypothetical protein
MHRSQDSFTLRKAPLYVAEPDQTDALTHQLAEAKRENEELRKMDELRTTYSHKLAVIIDNQAHEIAALKSQASEPDPYLSDQHGLPVYLAPPQAEALVEQLAEAKKDAERLKAIEAAAKNLVKAKGRYHSEIAMNVLIAAIRWKGE